MRRIAALDTNWGLRNLKPRQLSGDAMLVASHPRQARVLQTGRSMSSHEIRRHYQ